MRAISSSPDSDFTAPAPAAAAISRPALGATLLEYFLRFVVVALGIGLGWIVAVFIGLYTGLIEFRC